MENSLCSTKPLFVCVKGAGEGTCETHDLRWNGQILEKRTNPENGSIKISGGCKSIQKPINGGF